MPRCTVACGLMQNYVLFQTAVKGYYHASSCASAVLAVLILSCLSIHLSHDYFVTKPNNALWIF